MKISIVATKMKHKLDNGLFYYVEHPKEFNHATRQYECWFSPQNLLNLINHYATLDRTDERSEQNNQRVDLVREIQK